MMMMIEHRCRPDALRCDSGRCIPPQLICDGYVDCGFDDDSDERNCTGKQSSPVVQMVILNTVVTCNHRVLLMNVKFSVNVTEILNLLRRN